MSCEDIRAKLFAYFVHYLVEISVPVGDRGLNFIKKQNIEITIFFCMLTIFITSVSI